MGNILNKNVSNNNVLNSNISNIIITSCPHILKELVLISPDLNRKAPGFEIMGITGLTKFEDSFKKHLLLFKNIISIENHVSSCGLGSQLTSELGRFIHVLGADSRVKCFRDLKSSLKEQGISAEMILKRILQVCPEAF
jgi:hypothetical protein